MRVLSRGGASRFSHGDAVEQFHAPRVNAAFGACGVECASGLAAMAAVGEAAQTQVRPKLRKCGLAVVPREIRKAEFLQPRAVDDRGVAGTVKPRMTGCVAASG